ncbi:hypothetical protein RIF29_19251 [Crotalaria pallida]|uniref:Uncharacterized protein n=1 Tax=Crotalaria pallida TaxID=3830 RepID=A0AAN9I5C3_CROPI
MVMVMVMMMLDPWVLKEEDGIEEEEGCLSGIEMGMSFRLDRIPKERESEATDELERESLMGMVMVMVMMMLDPWVLEEEDGIEEEEGCLSGIEMGMSFRVDVSPLENLVKHHLLLDLSRTKESSHFKGKTLLQQVPGTIIDLNHLSNRSSNLSAAKEFSAASIIKSLSPPIGTKDNEK